MDNEIIEDWIVKQPWSNGNVGIHGHSWSGLTGFRVAATNPPHLKAIVVSGLFDDAVRGLMFIGGIRNVGFPVQWTSNFEREDGVFGSDDAAKENRNLSEEEKRKIRESRAKAGNDAPSRPRTLREIAGEIRAPIFLLHAYQDEQTGPSGVWLFDHMRENTPKRLLISDGHHGMPMIFLPQRRAWFDYWLRGERNDALPDIENEDSRVHVYFDLENSPKALSAPLVSSDFPLPETQWTRFYLAAGNELSTTPGTDTTKADSYDVTEARTDAIEYRLKFDEPTAICGPIVATLWASMTASNTDFFVTISDVAPDGRVRALQRGLLRASLSTLDEEMSVWHDHEDERLLLRPHHIMTKARNLEPGSPHKFEIEVHTVGHVFRIGHELSITISQPPVDDPVPYMKRRGGYKSGSYKYEQTEHTGTVTIHRDSEKPSNILLPILPEVPQFHEEIPEEIDLLWTEKG